MNTVVAQELNGPRAKEIRFLRVSHAAPMQNSLMVDQGAGPHISADAGEHPKRLQRVLWESIAALGLLLAATLPVIALYRFAG